MTVTDVTDRGAFSDITVDTSCEVDEGQDAGLQP